MDVKYPSVDKSSKKNGGDEWRGRRRAKELDYLMIR